jgi:rhodanese-related sulfurtransferase
MLKNRVPLNARTQHALDNHHIIHKLCASSAHPHCPLWSTFAPTMITTETSPDPELVRRPHVDPSAWAGEFVGRSAIVICQKGAKVSQGAAAWLRHAGVPADALEDGFEGWGKAGLPLVATTRMPPLDSQGRTVWVTRARPKVDRIACPWLIRRFIDPRAVFLFVAPAEVEGVAERFAATPFDVEGVFWSHRGETCTFDVMIEEFSLATEPLLRLAAIVRGADTGRMDAAPQAAGLLAASLGLSRLYADDLAQLEAGMTLYDAFIGGAGTPRRKPIRGIRRNQEPEMSAGIGGNGRRKPRSGRDASWPGRGP